jgi:hypothetical protein
MTIIIREITDDDIDQVVEVWATSGVARPWNDPATDIEFARRGPHSTIRLKQSKQAEHDDHGALYGVHEGSPRLPCGI